MIVRIYENSEYVRGVGKVDYYSFQGDQPGNAREVGHIDTGETPAEIRTDEEGAKILILGEEKEEYTATEIILNSAAHKFGIYYHGWKAERGEQA